MTDPHRQQLFSRRITAGCRTYFFDVKMSADGTRYLMVSESRKVGEKWEHHRVIVFEEQLETFLTGLKAAVDFLEPPDQAKLAPCIADSAGDDVDQVVEPNEKAYSVEEIRGQHPQAYVRWSVEDDQRLLASREQGVPVSELARRFQRQESAIRSRLSKLEVSQRVSPPKG